MDDRLSLFIEFWRQKTALFASGEGEGNSDYLHGMELALADAEILRDAPPEWVAELIRQMAEEALNGVR